ncbi:MAG: replication initiator protein [Microviridae sp.]|nr:MAG: replication initiator protein [Microviridae sp.]
MCYRPRYFKSKDATFPCGICPKCKARHVSAWSFRLLQELRVCSSAHFITLTYDQSNVPTDFFGNLNLSKRDLQLFFKRLRKAQKSALSVKYFAVGEYGGNTRRPHYHIILFNAKLELVERCWENGEIHNGKDGVTGASIGYCLKYILKHKHKRCPFGDSSMQPEFALMSKGLGASYLTESMANWHVADLVNRMYCNLTDGKKISMPRYYKDRLYYENERSAIREAFEISIDKEINEKLSKQTLREFRAEQAAIDNAFDRMYMSAQKTKL